MKFKLIESFNKDVSKFYVVIPFDEIEYSISLDNRSPMDPDHRSSDEEDKYDLELSGKDGWEDFYDAVPENYFEFSIINDAFDFGDKPFEQIEKEILDTDEFKEFVFDHAQEIVDSNVEFFRDYFYNQAQEKLEKSKQEEYDDGPDWDLDDYL